MKELGSYPVDKHLPEISKAVLTRAACLIKAEPGAGKTTRVPLFLLSSVKGKILVLEPRRLAARLSAERSAWFLGERCGQTVGFRIRQDARVSDKTRLFFITEGLFVRLLHQDPCLQGVDLVVLDEFHERSLHTDMALALVRHLQAGSRPDLKLLIMSATLDTRPLEAALDNVRLFDIPGRVFPVDVEYDPPPAEGHPGRRGWESQVVQAVQRLLADRRCPGSILVFLTGLGEILSVVSLLRQKIPPGTAQILPLAADLPFGQQQKVFEKPALRKVIVSTNVAETSLTLPDITGVVDSGLAKIPAMAAWSRMPTLEVRRTSRSSAIQRAGRAGRTRSGVAYRLYSKADFLARDPFTPPDIQRLDLSHALLDILSLGLSEALLPWFEPPGEAGLSAAWELLQTLGAVNEQNRLSGFGRALSKIPLHPRLGAVALAGGEHGCPKDALLAACLISEGFVLKSGDRAAPGPCDVTGQLDLLKASATAAGRRIDSGRADRVWRLYNSLAKSLGLSAARPRGRTHHRQLVKCLFRGFPDRVAFRQPVKRGKKSRDILYNFCLGRGGTISKSSALAEEAPECLVAVDAVENPKADGARGIQVWAGSTLDLATLKTDPGRLLRKETGTELNQRTGTELVVCELYYGKLKIETVRGGAPAAGTGQRLAAVLKAHWPYPFGDDAALKDYHRRVDLLSRHKIPHTCPVFEGDMLGLFFEMLCEGLSSLKDLEKKSLEDHLLDQLSPGDRETLNRHTPKALRLANGSRVRVRYPETAEPWSEGFVQDFFGLKSTPCILGGRHALKLNLLAPNRRVAQVTDNLPRFWQGAYHDVVKELRRRYPKHYWPEDPARAKPCLLKKNLTGETKK